MITEICKNVLMITGTAILVVSAVYTCFSAILSMVNDIKENKKNKK